jgi:predicted RNase H-like nuclease (RuvC/YqgF family)
MADVKFLTHYNETVIENFISVVKQNLLFQAQIRGLEEHLKIIPELQKSADQFEELKLEIVRLKDDNVNLTNQLESKKSIVENADKIDTDRFRLQTAVNTQMREISGYKETIENLQNQLKETIENFQKQLKKETEYTKQLEEMLPKTAKKKLGIEIVEQVTKEEVLKTESLPLNNTEKNIKVESSGGTF